MTNEIPIPPSLRWIGLVLLLAAGGFFLLFGLYLLVCAYRLEDPFHFVMTFFASNLVILISATLMVGASIRLFLRFRDRNNNQYNQHNTPDI